MIPLFIILFVFIGIWIYLNYLYNKCYYKIKIKNIILYIVLGLLCFFTILFTNTILNISYENNVIFTSLSVSLIEETIKISYILIGVFITRKINKQYIKSKRDIDFIVLNIILTFALIETLLYVNAFSSIILLLLRILISIPVHLICTLIFSYALYNNKYINILVPYTIHTIYNIIFNIDINILILISFFFIIYTITLNYIYELFKSIKGKEGYLYDRIEEYNNFKKINDKYNKR